MRKNISKKIEKSLVTASILISSVPIAGFSMPVFANKTNTYSKIVFEKADTYFTDAQLKSGQVTNIRFSGNKLIYSYNTSGKGYEVSFNISQSDFNSAAGSKVFDTTINIDGPNSSLNGTYQTKITKADLLFEEDDIQTALESADLENINNIIITAINNRKSGTAKTITSGSSSGIPKTYTYKQSSKASINSNNSDNTDEIITDGLGETGNGTIESEKTDNNDSGTNDENTTEENTKKSENAVEELPSENVEEGDSYILTAKESGTDRTIKGAVFKHTKPDGTTETLKTDKNGKVTVSNLEKGTHYFQETKVPKGYSLNNTIYHLKIHDGGTIEKTDKTTQKVYVRYENTDGSYTKPELVLDNEYNYGDTVDYIREADSVYEKAEVKYDVDGQNETTVDIKRKTNTLSFGEQLDGQKLADGKESTFLWYGTIDGKAVSGEGPFSTELKVGTKFDITVQPKAGYSLQNGNIHLSGTIKDKESSTSTDADNTTISTVTNHYKLTFDGSDYGDPVTSKTINYEEKYGELPTLTKKGHTFLGWYTAKDGGTKISADTVMDSEDVTVYPHWQTNKYELSFDTQGGNSIASQQIEYGTVLNDLPVPARTGYTFLGWYDKADNGNKVNGNNWKMDDHPLTLYAHWKVNEYTFTFDSNDGSESKSYKTITYGGTVGALPTVTRTGYTFSGWFDAKSDGNQISINTKIPDKNTTYYAHWTPIRYTISYNLNGGAQAGNKTSYTIEDSDFSLSDPVRKGYTFTGWTGSNGNTAQKSVTIKKGSTGNKSYTANWKKNGKNFQEFVNAYNGKAIDLDGAYGAQCYDGVYAYLGWGVYGNAYYYKNNMDHFQTAANLGANWRSSKFAQYCTQISFKNVRDGDILFWFAGHNGMTSAGHVAMYYSGTFFGQNQYPGDSSTGFNKSPIGYSYYGNPDVVLRPNFIAND